MTLSARIASAKITRLMLKAIGFLFLFASVILILFGIFGSVHTLFNSHAGVDSMKLGMAIGSLLYGLFGLFFGCIGIVIAELLEKKS